MTSFADRSADGPADVRMALEDEHRIHDQFDRQPRIFGVLLREERKQALQIVQDPRRVEALRH